MKDCESWVMKRTEALRLNMKNDTELVQPGEKRL